MNPNLNLWLCIPCYEYHLYSSEDKRTKYIHIQDDENIQRIPKKYNKKTNEYLIDMALDVAMPALL
jgi:hypothetical protein